MASDELKHLGTILAQVVIAEDDPATVIQLFETDHTLEKDYNKFISAELYNILSELFFRRGRALIALNRANDAVRDYARCVDMSAGRSGRKLYMERVSALGAVKYEAGDNGGCIRDMKTAIRLAPTGHTAHMCFNISMAYRRLRFTLGYSYWASRAQHAVAEDPRYQANYWFAALLASIETLQDLENFITVSRVFQHESQDDDLQSAKLEILRFICEDMMCRRVFQSVKTEGKDKTTAIDEEMNAVVQTLSKGKCQTLQEAVTDTDVFVAEEDQSHRQSLFLVLNTISQLRPTLFSHPAYMYRETPPSELVDYIPDRCVVEDELDKLPNMWRICLDDSLAADIEYTPDIGEIHLGLPSFSFFNKSMFCTSDSPESYDYIPTLIDTDGTHVLDADNLRKLHRTLPRRCQMRPWQLMYSTKQHGISMRTFLNRCVDVSPVLVVVHNGSTHFGAFSATPLNHTQRYSGTGETFLWTERESTDAMLTYNWSRSNEYFLLVNHEGIAFGGGGHYGLFIDHELVRGTTGDCATFASHALCIPEDFEIEVFEVWAFL